MDPRERQRWRVGAIESVERVPLWQAGQFADMDYEFLFDKKSAMEGHVTYEPFMVEKQGARGWVMSPCSGHGFKFGALMGLELARTIASPRSAPASRRR